MIDALGISWPLATVSGYGIYGVEIAQSFFRRGGKKLLLTQPPVTLALPPLLELRLAPALQLAPQFAALLRQDTNRVERFPFPVLHGAGNDFAGFTGSDQVRGSPNIGCVAIEHLYCSPHGRAVAQNYDKLIAISQFNADWLKSLNIAPVVLCHQGIDTDLFYPQAKRGLFGDRFIIFSGGKFEFRKGQDIVLTAFKQFAAKYPEALLVCAWQGQSEPAPNLFAATGHIQDTPQADGKGGLAIAEWLQRQGLQPHQFIALPYTHQMMMPPVLRECDAALFPNRCEGGTNLVAMEAMACGVPTLVADNTGQHDLVALAGAAPLTRQSPCLAPTAAAGTTTGWGECDVTECVVGLECIYHDSQAARAAAATVAAKMRDWQWDTLNAKLLAALG